MKNLLTAITLSSAVAFASAAPATMMTQSNPNTNMNPNATTGTTMKTNANTSQTLPTQNPPVQNIQLSNNQQTVEINLPANATTGYQWFVKNYDHNLVTLQRYNYNPETTTRIGAGGTATFVFAINPHFYAAPQTSTIQFIYQQPWNPGQNVSTSTVTLTSTASNNSANTNSAGTTTTNDNWLSLPSAMQINS